MELFDAVIIGSGPSGASTAIKLAEAGWKIALVEKEILPRYKTCGGGLVYRGRNYLPFDISSAVERELHQVEIIFGKKRPLIFKAQREKPIVTMIMRDSFDSLLVNQAKKHGLVIFEGEKIIGLENAENKDWAIVNTDKRSIAAKFVIAADGALSPTAKLAGWPETRLMCPALEYEIKVSPTDFERLSKTVRFDMDVVPKGYGWCFPKKNHLSVGVGNFMKLTKTINLKTYYKDYLQTLGISNVLEEQAHGFVIPISPRTDGFVKHRVFLIGDAAGFADPVTAEGISNAILSGNLVAKALIESKANLDEATLLYQQYLDEKILPELLTGIQLAKLFYNNQKLRNLMLKKLGQMAAEAMTDVFMGVRSYPKDYKESIRRRLKLMVFS
ncbi:MAG: geranylgeranyl reductase family protein [Flavobacteriaceae bacterium]|nr:geranylgeranyl reductase family protein [Flavobacteriaceae bacterium]